MSRFEVVVPPQLEGWGISFDGHEYVLLEWSAASVDLAVPLTEAERDVLAGIVRGESNAAIARRRRSRPRTVANQVACLYRKVGVRSRAQLVARMVGRDASA